MSNPKSRIQSLSQAQRERLASLEVRVFFTGELRRSEIETRFGIKPAASSRDLTSYRELAPNNLDYDAAARCYRPTAEFSPLFELQGERVLAWLQHGFGDGLCMKLKQVAPYEGSGNLGKLNLLTLAAVTRALCAKRALHINYLSLQSGSMRREIVPVALGDDGMRLYVRAFDRTKERFGDFVLTRITKFRELAGSVGENELLVADEQWARIVELELVPHPGIACSEAIEVDYGMQGGVARVKVRAAVAGYLLRRWSIDSSPDHSLDPASHHLWLKNPQTLYGVESAALAPGYPDSEKALADA